MNGRAYDYNLGRFLSVDPIIQAPGNSQSLNPYSYIMNNPLAGTDPTGYRSKKLGSNIYTEDENISTTGSIKNSDATQSLTIGKDFVTATSSNGSITVNMNTTQMQSVLDKFGQIEISKNTNLSSQPTGIAEPLQGSSLRGMYYSLVRGGTLGIVYGEISSSPWLNADPQQSADIEAYENEAGLSQYAIGAFPGNAISKAVPLIRATITKGAKRGPKTDPNAPHNKKIREIADQIEAQYGPGSIKAGGGRLPEVLLPTPGGYKNGRRPDILYENDCGVLCGINVGKAKQNGMPIKREQQALDDLSNNGIPTIFVRYN